MAAEDRWHVWCGWLAAGLFLMMLAGGLYLLQPDPDVSQLLQKASIALKRREFGRADACLQQALEAAPQDPEVRLVAAESAAEQQQFVLAVEHLNCIENDSSQTAVTARCQAGDIFLLHLKRLSAAEHQYRLALEQDPHNLLACDRLAFLLGLAASSREAVPYRLELIRQGEFTPVHLFLLCIGNSAVENLEELQQFQQSVPDDLRVLLGLARHATDEQRYSEARGLLKRVIERQPDLIEAHAQLGHNLLKSGDTRQFSVWARGLPERALEHSDVWAAFGTWAMEHDRPEEAQRCFWEAVRRDPNHERSNYQLSRGLRASGAPELAKAFRTRSSLLSEYFNVVKIAYLGTDVGRMREAARLAEELGLLWEATGWHQLLLRRGGNSFFHRRALVRLRDELEGQPQDQRAIPEVNPTRMVDLSSLPLPDWGAVLATGPDSGGLSGLSEFSTPVFQNEARAVGLEFQYYNGAGPQQTDHKMYEFTGGGTAALDYDVDGWPDVYLSQGAASPFSVGPQNRADVLYRNGADGEFEEIAQPAGLQETSFSQGVTVGDFNGDGFPDLYVANIGPNRFFLNNGDGTFSDVTAETGTGANDWSTSCVLADLNSDGLPDLYVVNYLAAPDVFERVCPDSSGVPRSCSPRHFPAAQDRFYLNRGDGRFEERTAASGFEVPDGKGLGVVAADLEGSGRLALFVANDAVPNFFFINEAGQPGELPQFVEQALISGLSVDLDGRPQACMGVAVDDVNGDGELDLFVTNFHNESNTLYQQISPQQFADVTQGSGLYDSSLKMVGFGTQFLDGELDGRPDLIIANGDVDDFRDIGRLWAMTPQYLRNRGEGHFELLNGSVAGDYFAERYVGRSLARLDWNRDGLEDVVVSHLDAPAALLTNRTAVHGNHLAVQLRGVETSRDAIGTTVTVVIGDRRLSRQLTAGDGYQCTNQRQLVFGLGSSDQVDELHVRWPGGRQQQFGKLASNQQVLLTEGAETPLQLWHHP